MASILKVDTLTGVTTAGSIAVTGEGNSTTTNLQQGLAKTWARIAGDGTSIVDSFNVASHADDGTGIGTATFTAAMADANFSYTGGTATASTYLTNLVRRGDADAAGTVKYVCANTSNAAADTTYARTLTIHGDLA
jgi:hypothetical protein